MTFRSIPDKVFITGTDTGVGKTLVSAILMAGLQGKYWKPIQSGLEEITDTEWVRQVTGLPIKHFLPETYRLALPLSPHESAKAEGIRIDLEAFELPDTDQHLIVEGAGGLLVPLNETHFMIDLIRKLAIPVLLVARSELGTINHTLLSLDQLRRYDIEILGVVMNGVINRGNREAIEHFGKAAVLAEIEPMKAINQQNLKQAFRNFFPASSIDCGSKTTAIQKEGTHDGNHQPQVTNWHHSPVHVFIPESLYIVTASTFKKRRLFFDDERLQILQKALFEITRSSKWQLHAWSLFSNHYHIIISSTDEGVDLKRLVQKLHSITAIKVNQLDNAPGRKVWFQYWDTCLTYEESYIARLNYVHNNPVKHQLVSTATKYRFCSAKWFDDHADKDYKQRVDSTRFDRVELPDDF